MLTAHSNILDKSIIYSEDAYLTKAMKPIYMEVRQVKSKSKSQSLPKLHLDVFERKVAAVGGVWHKVHDSIYKAFDVLLDRWQDSLIVKIGESFDSIHNDF